GASLRAISRDLRGMDARKVTGIFRRALEGAARPYPLRVRLSALSIPVKPDGKHTGLRARIAQCAQVASWTDSREAGVAVWIDVRKMLPDYRTLPLYMEGVPGSRGQDYRRWRHPVYGNREVWRSQAAHPYFFRPVEPLGRAAGESLRRSLEDIKRQLNG